MTKFNALNISAAAAIALSSITAFAADANMSPDAKPEESTMVGTEETSKDASKTDQKTLTKAPQN